MDRIYEIVEKQVKEGSTWGSGIISSKEGFNTGKIFIKEIMEAHKNRPSYKFYEKLLSYVLFK